MTFLRHGSDIARCGSEPSLVGRITMATSCTMPPPQSCRPVVVSVTAVFGCGPQLGPLCVLPRCAQG